MALDQFTAESLAQAYERGDFDQVNNILGGGGISAQDVQNYWGFDTSGMADLEAAGVKFAPALAPVRQKTNGYMAPATTVYSSQCQPYTKNYV